MPVEGNVKLSHDCPVNDVVPDVRRRSVVESASSPKRTTPIMNRVTGSFGPITGSPVVWTIRRLANRSWSGRRRISEYTLLFSFIMCLIPCFVSADPVNNAKISKAISAIKLTPESLPAGMTIARELHATEQQLRRVRARVGFPMQDLLNQWLTYENERAQVNYLYQPNPEWFRFGYSLLVETNGNRSLILNKGNVIIQVGATTPELEDMIAYLFPVDPVNFLKIRSNRLTKDWRLIEERLLTPDDFKSIEEKVGAAVESGLIQKFIKNRLDVKVTYYNFETAALAEAATLRMARQPAPLFKRTVKAFGQIVVSVDSQSEELTLEAFELLNW